MEAQKRKTNPFCRVGTSTSYRDMLLLAHRPLRGGAAPACFHDLVCDCFLWCSSAHVDGASPRVFRTHVDGTFPCVLSSCGGCISTCVQFMWTAHLHVCRTLMWTMYPRVFSTHMNGTSPRVLRAQSAAAVSPNEQRFWFTPARPPSVPQSAAWAQSLPVSPATS